MRDETVAYHEVGSVAVQVQVGERALALLDYHLFGIEDEPDRAGAGVGEDLPHAVELLDQVLERLEHLVLGEREVRNPLQDRPGDAGGRALDGEDAVQPPARDVGEAEEAQRFARRRAVHDDDIVFRLLVVVDQVD